MFDSVVCENQKTSTLHCRDM